MSLTRRYVLVAGCAGGTALANTFFWPGSVRAEDEAVQLVERLTGQAPTVSDRLHLVMPAVFPTGYTVPMDLDIESPFDLMGLYQGVSLDRKSVLDLSAQPDMVFLYRRAILDYWAEGEETLGALVTHVLVHEIGHHFGLSDADMEGIEAEAGG